MNMLNLDTLSQLGVMTLYLIAMVNPVSKIAVLVALSPKHAPRELAGVVAKSSAVAACILFASMVCGVFLLTTVFRVELNSLKLAGGLVLVWVGFNALRSGVFFEQEGQARFADMAIVPLACPMIAGPATIAASIELKAHHGLWLPTCAMLAALMLNYVLMLFSRSIGAALARYNILGALVRITGLIVMTIGTQMALDGITGWRAAIK